MAKGMQPQKLWWHACLQNYFIRSVGLRFSWCCQFFRFLFHLSLSFGKFDINLQNEQMVLEPIDLKCDRRIKIASFFPRKQNGIYMPHTLQHIGTARTLGRVENKGKKMLCKLLVWVLHNRSSARTGDIAPRMVLAPSASAFTDSTSEYSLSLCAPGVYSTFWKP